MDRPIRFASACNAPRNGFTLVEMSLVLIVVGLVILVVFPALQTLRLASQQRSTQDHLDNLMRATAAFVHANGCLPCPTPASTTGAGFGHVRGDIIASACGSCPVPEGLVPYLSLGLPSAVAKDGWKRWITMRVDPALTLAFGVIPPTAPCLASDPQPCTPGTSQKGFCRPGLSYAAAPTVSTPGGGTLTAAVIFVSHGANGYGAYRASPTVPASNNDHPAFGGSPAPCSTLGGFERCNANGDISFVDADRTMGSTAPFDDVLRAISRNALVSSLGSGACQTPWGPL